MFSKLTSILPKNPLVGPKEVVTDSGNWLEEEEEEALRFPALNEQHSPFVQVALFDSSELKLGDLLREGTFTEVSEIKEIVLRPKTSRQISHSTCISTVQKVARRSCQRHCVGSNGERHFVVKSLKRGTRKDAGFQKACKKILREIQFMKTLDHENIAHLRGSSLQAIGGGSSSSRSSYFLVLDRAKETLDSRLKRWRRSRNTVGLPDERLIPIKSNYAFQLSSVLEYLHRRRIVYRDLKASNVAFRSEHSVQLFDFSNVRTLPTGNGDPDELFCMTAVGARRYAACEVISKGKYNTKADVYSWAMVYYEMLAETRPYYNLSAGEHRLRVCEEGSRPFLSLRFLTPSIDVLLRKAWDQDVGRRVTISTVCHEMLDILMNLDTDCPDIRDEEGEYLFDLMVDDEENVSELDSEEIQDMSVLLNIDNSEHMNAIMDESEYISEHPARRARYDGPAFHTSELSTSKGSTSKASSSRINSSLGSDCSRRIVASCAA